jgi:glycosyltransferase involved in cell wall biosynthesis
LEVIVVDDCSTDNTVEVVKAYPDSKVRCIVLEKNSGAQAARNRGICEAKGDWIAFQDSDDEWVQEKLERQIAELAKFDFDPLTVIHADCLRYNPSTKEKCIWNIELVEGDDVLPRILRAPGPLFPTILTSKVSLERVGFLDEAVPAYQEWETSIRLAEVCRFVHIKKPLFVYYLHAGETISKNQQKDIEGYQYIVDKYRDVIVEQCGVQILNDHIIVNVIKAVRYGLREEAFNILSKYFKSSLRLKILKWLIRCNIDPDFCERFMRRCRSYRLLS